MAFPDELITVQTRDMSFDTLKSKFANRINNLEAKVGINNSAVATSLDYLLKNPASIDPGHKHSNVLTTNETYTVKTAGGDFTTVQAALAAAKDVTRSGNATIVISVDPGIWVIDQHLHGSTDLGIFIQGSAPITKSLTSIQSSAGGADNFSVVLNLNNITGLAIGDYAIITGVAGGTNPTYISGIFPITNVDAGNSRITVTSTHHYAAPSGNVTGTITVPKTIFSFVGNGFVVYDKTYLGLQDVIIVGDGTGTGLDIQDTSRLATYGHVGLYNWTIGALMNLSASGYATSLAIGGCPTGISMQMCCSLNGLLYLNGNPVNATIHNCSFIQFLVGSVVTGSSNTGVNTTSLSGIRCDGALNITGNNFGIAQCGNSILVGTPTYANNNAANCYNHDYSTVTLTAGTTTVVPAYKIKADSLVFLQPTNLAATVTTLQPYISSIVAGTSFTITHVGAAGTETFNYRIWNQANK